jgi:hypothetical protein
MQYAANRERHYPRMINVTMKHVVWILGMRAIVSFAGEGAAESGWVPLFNGKSLDGWYTFLQKSGKNNDSSRIFKAERGMIHILDLPTTQDASEVFGYLSSEREFAHCRIRAEFKWGKKRFAPRAEEKRDSGLFYYVVGPDKIWPTSLHLQVQETDVGDLWMNGGAGVTTSIENDNPPTYGASFVLRHQQRGRIAKLADFEDRDGWNSVEMILDGDKITHLVNGRVVLRAWNVRQPDPNDPSKTIPLDHGRLLLEAEGAEIWFRNVQMKPLPAQAPPAPARVPDEAPLSLDSSFHRLLGDSRSRDVLELILSAEVLSQPGVDQLDMPARIILPFIATLTDEQTQALDRALRALPVLVKPNVAERHP